jgi:uncharacterized membrane protein
MLIVRWIHLIAAAVWMGGLITLAALVVALRGEGASRETLRAAARQFSRLSWSAMAVAVVTGLVQVEWLGLALSDPDVVAKLVFVGAAIAIAGFHQWTARTASPAARGAIQGLILLTSLGIFGAAVRLGDGPVALPMSTPSASPLVRQAVAPGTDAPRGDGPRVYYDGVHGARHLWNRDNRRYRTDYHTLGGWFRFMEALRTAGYEVWPETHASFDAATLAEFDVVMIGEQTYHGRFMTEEERSILLNWVKEGGGLFLTVEHTNAHYMGDVFNQLVADLPIKARFDSICDEVTSHPTARDWVQLPNITPHPVTEGVREYWFYNGCSLDTPHGVLSSADEAWSDKYAKKAKPVHNGNNKRDPNELGGPLAGVAAFEWGKGRVVVIGDHNAYGNSDLYLGDHHRFGLNAVQWLAKAEDRPELVDWDYPDGFDLFTHLGAGSQLDMHRKTRKGGFRSVYSFFTKEPQLRAWARHDLEAGHEVLLLGAPLTGYTRDELAVIDGYFAAGRSVVWLATADSLSSEAARQLSERYAFNVTKSPPQLTFRTPLNVLGRDDWGSEVFRVYADKNTPTVRVSGLEPQVQLTAGGWHVEERKYDRDDVLIDLVSTKTVGQGTLYVVAPFDLFDDEHLPGMYGEFGDLVRQQTAELALRIVKRAAGDTTVMAD